MTGPSVSLSRSKKLLFASVSLVLFFGGSELILRLSRFHYNPYPAPMVIWNTTEDAGIKRKGALHRFDAHTLWAPLPFAKLHRFPGEKINAAGYRGPLVSRDKKEGELRLATMGDSSTFGMTVPFEQCWSERLRTKMGEWLGRRKVDVVDAGVIGFTVVQGYQRFHRLVADFRPDVVVLAFGAINEHFPSSVCDVEKIERSKAEATNKLLSTFRWMTLRLRLLQICHRAKDKIKGSIRDRAGERREDVLEKNLEFKKYKDGKDYQRRVSAEEYRDYLERLIDSAAAIGCRAVLLSVPRRPTTEEEIPYLLEYTRAMGEVAREKGVPLADGRGRFRTLLGLEGDLAGDPLTEEELFNDKHHPTERGHEVLAELLIEAIAPLFN